MISPSLHRSLLAITSLLVCASGLLAAPDASEIVARHARFHALLDRPHGPLHPTLTTTTEGEFTVEHGGFDSEKGQIVPFLTYRKTAATGRLAAVVMLHGTGGNKEGMAGDLRDLARRGMLAIAPRLMLILNGENDPNCPLGGAKLAFATAQEAYKQAGAEDKLEIDVASGVGHAVTPAQHAKAMDWLARHLSKPDEIKSHEH